LAVTVMRATTEQNATRRCTLDLPETPAALTTFVSMSPVAAVTRVGSFAKVRGRLPSIDPLTRLNPTVGITDNYGDQRSPDPR
jgi:hypothetical protein